MYKGDQVGKVTDWFVYRGRICPFTYIPQHSFSEYSVNQDYIRCQQMQCSSLEGLTDFTGFVLLHSQVFLF